jgi:hypothetical protein
MIDATELDEALIDHYRDLSRRQFLVFAAREDRP